MGGKTQNGQVMAEALLTLIIIFLFISLSYRMTRQLQQVKTQKLIEVKDEPTKNHQ